MIAGYFGNIGVGTRTPSKKLEIDDKCIFKQDTKCATRKGQLMLSASWRNTLMSKVKTTYYDMIGSYANWAKGKSVVYIAAHDSQARPVTAPVDRVYFGGIPRGRVKPMVRFEAMNGKFYATKFVKKVKLREVEEISRRADVFLDMGVGETTDLVDTAIALKAKTRRHHHQLAQLETDAKDLAEQMSKLKLRLQAMASS
jgi:hypothetical protein